MNKKESRKLKLKNYNIDKNFKDKMNKSKKWKLHLSS